MIKTNKLDILEIGFDLKIGDNNGKLLFKPLLNNDYLDKNDIVFKYDDIEDFFSETFTIPANTYDIKKEWNKINFLTIKAFSKFKKQPFFNLKISSKNNQVLNLNEFVHLQFVDAITEYYLSNPGDEDLKFEVMYVKNRSSSDKISDNYYRKTDSLLYWNIQHNLGSIPNYLFLDSDGLILDPEHTVEIQNENILSFRFTDVFNGYIYLTTEYVFTQTTPSLTWTIEHNLNDFPNMIVTDENNAPLTDYTIDYIDKNKLILNFETEHAGSVVLY